MGSYEHDTFNKLTKEAVADIALWEQIILQCHSNCNNYQYVDIRLSAAIFSNCPRFQDSGTLDPPEGTGSLLDSQKSKVKLCT